MMMAVIGVTASAQVIAFVCDGEVLKDGSTYCSTRQNEVYASLGWLYFEPEVCVVSQTGGNVEVTAESLDGKEIELCFGGGCQNGTSITSRGNVTAGKEEDILLHANAKDAETATYEVRLTAKSTDGSATITLVMSNNPEVTSVDNVEEAIGVISIEGHALSYSFGHTANRSIDIYTACGSKVLSIDTKAMKGHIDLEGLGMGVYVYHVTGVEKPLCGKFFLK